MADEDEDEVEDEVETSETSETPVTPVTPEAPEAADVAPEPARPKRTGTRTRTIAIVSLRFLTGIVGVAAAAIVVTGIGLTPLPVVGLTPPAVTVTPQPADQLRTCAGGALRLGDESGENADKPESIGAPDVRSDSVASSLSRTQIGKTDAGTDGSNAAPQVLTLSPADGATLSGAQSQAVDAPDYNGFAAAACAEPTSSVWLAGGATTTGRTSLITITNPTAVPATVRITILGEDGQVTAPGLSGITIPAGAQRIFSLAGFAPGLVSPVVHIEARGGQVVAFLQQSIVRGLDSVGVDVVDAGADPARQLTIPGVRVLNAVGVNSALTLSDWQDVGPAVRIAVPGTKKAKVTVNVIPVDPKVDGTSFQTTIDPGKVEDLALDSGAEVDTGVALADGTYTVTIESDQPVVAGVRVSTAVGDGGDQGDAAPQAPPSDLAWYASSPALTGDTLVSIAPGPDPQLELTNPTKAEVTVVAKAQGGGSDITIKVPGNGAATVAVKEGLTYLLTAAKGLHAAVSYAGDAQLAAYPVTSSRPVSGPIVIRP